MAKKRRKAAKSAKKSAKKTSPRLAKARAVQGFAAMTSGLVDMAVGVGPKFTELPDAVHGYLIEQFAKRRTHFLKVCGTSMAAKYLIVKVPSLGKY